MAELPKMKSPVVTAIEDAYAAAPKEGERGYLGASSLGEPCERRLWYGFRFAVEPEQFDGRMLRLFATGHREEARLLDDLRAAGADVATVDPATGEQWLITFADGHGGGHCDARATGVPGAPVVEHVVECKTHNEKSFAQLVKHGVQIAKPVHFAQMQIYMHWLGITRALYLAHNKNTDELHSERVHYDAAAALTLVAKAERIVAAQSPPARISNDPDWFECRFCPAHELCHEGGWARRTCRTCLHSTPTAGGTWTCALFGALSFDVQRAGCPSHLYLPGLVPGEQLNATGWEEGEGVASVTYRLWDGTDWQDDGGLTRPQSQADYLASCEVADEAMRARGAVQP